MKNRILYTMRIFEDYSGEVNPITIKEIIKHLDKYGISAERKAVYQDIESLIGFGLDIVSPVRGKYFLAGREFELPEIRLLIDAVRSAQFISEKKTNQLCKKLAGLLGEREKNSADLGIISKGKTVKTDNEQIYYIVDTLTKMITKGSLLSFKYYEYSEKGKKQPKHGGKSYHVKPLATLWDNQRYYMVAYDLREKKLKHFRVDKLFDLKALIIKKEIDMPLSLDTASYIKKVFSMFSGKEENVRLRFDNSLMGVAIERFGEDILVTREDGESFSTSVKVHVSPTFYGWVFSFLGKVKILSPKWVKEDFESNLTKF